MIMISSLPKTSGNTAVKQIEPYQATPGSGGALELKGERERESERERERERERD